MHDSAGPILRDSRSCEGGAVSDSHWREIFQGKQEGGTSYLVCKYRQEGVQQGEWKRRQIAAPHSHRYIKGENCEGTGLLYLHQNWISY